MHLIILCLSCGTAEKKSETILMGLRANIVVPEEQDAYMFS